MTVITNVENLVHGGRCLVGYSDHGEYVAGWPEVARESIRAINHLTDHGPIPAPTLYRMLGELKGVGHLLPQALAQMARGLQKSLELYQYIDNRLRGVEGQLAQQAVYNATNNGLIDCLRNQVAALQGMTKTVIPDSNICPPPMPRYNSWTAPTAGASTGG